MAAQNPRDMILTFGKKHKDIPQLKFISEKADDLEVKAIENSGCVNFIYLVQTSNGKYSVLLKYAEEHPRNEAIDVIIPLERQLLEYNCLKKIHSLVPGGVPEPYVYDQEMNIIAMEYLADMEVLGPALCRGEVDPELAVKIGTILGQFHFRTHRKIVSKETWKEYKRTLTNAEVLDVMLHFRFDIFENFKEPGMLLRPVDVPLFKKYLSEINSKKIYHPIKKLFRQEECLILQDANCLGAMFYKNRTALIDFEFGGLGHHSFSLGHLSSFYYMAIFDRHNARKNDMKELQEITKISIRKMVDAFLSEFGEDVHIVGPKSTFISAFAGIFGHTLFAWPACTVFDTFIDVEHEDKVDFMGKGYQLMSMHHNISTLEEIFVILFDGSCDKSK